MAFRAMFSLYNNFIVATLVTPTPLLVTVKWSEVIMSLDSTSTLVQWVTTFFYGVPLHIFRSTSRSKFRSFFTLFLDYNLPNCPLDA